MSLDSEPPPLTPLPDAGSVLAADAAAAHATDPHAGGHGHHGPFHTHCENCGTKLEGPWCHRCGQHDFEFHRSFRHVFLEALESFFHFDGTFFRSTKTLLFRPGQLTMEFNAGKRIAQMPPFRLYVFVAFVFFLLMHFGAKPENAIDVGLPKSGSQIKVGNEAASAGEALKAAISELKDEVRAGVDPRDGKGQTTPAGEKPVTTEQSVPAAAGPAGEPPPATEAAAPTDPVGSATPKKKPATLEENPKLEAWLNQLAERATDKEQRRILGEKFFAAIPKVLLVCLPVFALLTRLLFRKDREFVYLKHLVLALHFHTFIYLWMLFAKGTEWLVALPGWGLEKWVSFGATLWMVAYPFLMLRRLFGNSWPKTFVKTTLLFGSHVTVLGIAIATTAFLIFAL